MKLRFTDKDGEGFEIRVETRETFEVSLILSKNRSNSLP